MKDFTIKKQGKYFKSIYLGYEDKNIHMKLYRYTDNLHEDRESVEKYINYIRKLTPYLEKKLQILNLNYDAKKIIRYNLNTIDGLALGLDPRSDRSKSDIAIALIESFDTQYNKAKNTCKSILNSLKLNPVHYLANWERFEEYKNLNDLYELEMDSLDKYYAEDPLVSIIKNIDKINDIIDKTKDIK